MAHKIKNLVLSLTGKCNFKCRYCYAAEHNKNKMTAETACAAIKLAAEKNGGEKFIVQFSGGEPLLNFGVLKEAALFVRKNNFPARLQLQTNASLITNEIAQFLYAQKIAIGVSLDGRPNVNDRLRLRSNGYGATAETLKGIEILRRNNIACGVTCVVTDENVSELMGLIEFAYFLGNVRKIGFDILRGQGRGAQLAPPSAEAMRSAMKDVLARRDELARLAGYKIAITQEERVHNLQREIFAREKNFAQREFAHCYAMNGEAAFVDAKGNIYACSSFVGDEEFYIGSVAHGIDDNLQQKVQQKIRARMKFCRTCADFSLCGGGCFARWQGVTAEEGCSAECEMMRAVTNRTCK